MTDKPTALVADDDPATAQLIQSLLEAKGFSTVVAWDGVQALSAAVNHRPRLVVLDVGMPKLDGYAVCRGIRDNRALSHARIVFCSARTGAEDKDHAFAAGGDVYLTKPLNVRDIVREAEGLLGRGKS